MKLKRKLADLLPGFGLGDGGEYPSEEHLDFCGEQMIKTIVQHIEDHPDIAEETKGLFKFLVTSEKV